jgi:hypothetical protein
VNSEYSAQDVVEVVTMQRNAALDEIVRQAVMIKALERELKALKIEYDIPPDKRVGDLFTGLDGLRSVAEAIGS